MCIVYFNISSYHSISLLGHCLEVPCPPGGWWRRRPRQADEGVGCGSQQIEMGIENDIVRRIYFLLKYMYIYLYNIYIYTYMFWFWCLYRWCHMIALETALTSWKFAAPKTDMVHQLSGSCLHTGCQDVMQISESSSSCERQNGLILQTWIYHHQKWGEKSGMFLIKHGNHGERPTSFILFPPFLDQTSRRETWSWWHNPMGPVPVPSSGWIHPSKFAWTPHGRSWKINFLPHSCHVWQFRWGFMVCNHLQSSPPNP